MTWPAYGADGWARARRIIFGAKAVRCGGAKVEQRRRDDAVTAGRTYHELIAAGGVMIPYQSAEDIHLDRFTYGSHMHAYRDGFIESDLERVVAGLASAMS